MDYIDKLAWIHVVDRRVLITRSKGKDTYYIPGGKREHGESDHEALIREIQEELSVDLLPEKIKYLETFEAQAHGKPEGTLVRMTCYTGEYEGEIKAASEIEEFTWFDFSDASKASLVDRLIFDWLKDSDKID